METHYATEPHQDLHHPLMVEFPEHRQAITTLKQSDDRFRELFDEYHRVDDEICQIEEHLRLATEQEFEELRLRRVFLKDKLYNMVRRTQVA